MESSAIIQASNRLKSQAEEEMRIQEQLLESQAKVAESRFKKGCVIVVAVIDPKKFTSLTEGLPVIDWVRKTPLSSGTVVCDANGNTAVIEKRDGKPVVGKTFYTGNQALIDKAKSKANAQYRVPNI
jgi:hypothetical protein